MEVSIKKRYLLIIGIVVVISLFMISKTMFKPIQATESTNVRFNQWVSYYRRNEGYSVEYYNFDTFKNESDIVVSKMTSTLALGILQFKEAEGSVTVYFDWESDIIFYRGKGPDSTKLYCYFSRF